MLLKFTPKLYLYVKQKNYLKRSTAVCKVLFPFPRKNRGILAQRSLGEFIKFPKTNLTGDGWP
jgi:hypothetical protein